jgi:hypothetical protein
MTEGMAFLGPPKVLGITMKSYSKQYDSGWSTKIKGKWVVTVRNTSTVPMQDFWQATFDCGGSSIRTAAGSTAQRAVDALVEAVDLKQWIGEWSGADESARRYKEAWLNMEGARKRLEEAQAQLAAVTVDVTSDGFEEVIHRVM